MRRLAWFGIFFTVASLGAGSKANAIDGIEAQARFQKEAKQWKLRRKFVSASPALERPVSGKFEKIELSGSTSCQGCFILFKIQLKDFEKTSYKTLYDSSAGIKLAVAWDKPEELVPQKLETISFPRVNWYRGTLDVAAHEVLIETRDLWDSDSWLKKKPDQIEFQFFYTVFRKSDENNSVEQLGSAVADLTPGAHLMTVSYEGKTVADYILELKPYSVGGSL